MIIKLSLYCEVGCPQEAHESESSRVATRLIMAPMREHPSASADLGDRGVDLGDDHVLAVDVLAGARGGEIADGGLGLGEHRQHLGVEGHVLGCRGCGSGGGVDLLLDLVLHPLGGVGGEVVVLRCGRGQAEVEDDPLELGTVALELGVLLDGLVEVVLQVGGLRVGAGRRRTGAEQPGGEVVEPAVDDRGEDLLTLVEETTLGLDLLGGRELRARGEGLHDLVEGVGCPAGGERQVLVRLGGGSGLGGGQVEIGGAHGVCPFGGGAWSNMDVLACNTWCCLTALLEDSAVNCCYICM